jgi:hypothetical protein
MTNLDDELLNDGAELTLAELETTLNPVLERVRDRLLGERGADPIKAAHGSHSSSSGRGHSSYVSGRFEDLDGPR